MNEPMKRCRAQCDVLLRLEISLKSFSKVKLLPHDVNFQTVMLAIVLHMCKVFKQLT